ncbi:hypothetical protein EV1_002407 [Malus domestica]
MGTENWLQHFMRLVLNHGILQGQAFFMEPYDWINCMVLCLLWALAMLMCLILWKLMALLRCVLGPQIGGVLGGGGDASHPRWETSCHDGLFKALLLNVAIPMVSQEWDVDKKGPSPWLRVIQNAREWCSTEKVFISVHVGTQIGYIFRECCGCYFLDPETKCHAGCH